MDHSGRGFILLKLIDDQQHTQHQALFPGSRPAFRLWQYVLQTMAGPGERGMNLGISDSEYELSYICALALGSAGFLSSMEWLCIEQTKMAENSNTTLFDNEFCTINDGKPFSETTWLTCARLVRDKIVGPT